MSTPFQPIDGSGLSRAQIVYRTIRDRPTGDIIPYDQLPFDRTTIRGLRVPVARLFEREQQRTVVCVPDEGWQIVQGARQAEEAARVRRQSTRRMGRALQIASSVDRRELSGEERLHVDAELVKASTGYHMLRGIASRRLGIDDIRGWEDGRP